MRAEGERNMKAEYVKHNIDNIIVIKNIVTLHYFEFERNFLFKGERHDFWEMVYADKGPLQIVADDEEITLLPGECYFHKPNEFHIHKADGIKAPNIFVITFVCESERMNVFESKRIKVPDKFKSIISKIIDEGKRTFDLPFNNPNLKQLQLLDDGIVGGQQMIRIYLEQLLILLLRYECNREKNDVFVSEKLTTEKLAEKMLKKLDSMVYENVSVEQFCRGMNYSKVYLSKVFLKNYGCTIKTYINKIKIEEAKKLIREHNYNFTQISDQLCFSNPLYFSRVFKRVTSMSPSEYKNSVKID